ncbi:hypothetical protein [Coxiella burnetii]|uniref:hypothetical protein n=1 Tax=Coxiella burnetii TaxID=777 RepID=UPI000CCF1D87|nr:hypothetical protein [Coxiella burnetii]PNT89216.1 hypothetical protein C2L89_05945 [Coxiella burnetii]
MRKKPNVEENPNQKSPPQKNKKTKLATTSSNRKRKPTTPGNGGGSSTSRTQRTLFISFVLFRFFQADERTIFNSFCK